MLPPNPPPEPFALVARPHSPTAGRATLSPCGRYRYDLTRDLAPEVDQPGRRVLFIMLNPSTADAGRSDPTLTRCLGYARDWGYAGLALVNLFAWRTPDPADLRHAADPVGPANDQTIRAWLGRPEVGAVVCAWGAGGSLWSRDAAVLRLIRESRRPVLALKLTLQGHPQHPLYLGKHLQPVAWDPGA